MQQQPQKSIRFNGKKVTAKCETGPKQQTSVSSMEFRLSDCTSGWAYHAEAEELIRDISITFPECTGICRSQSGKPAKRGLRTMFAGGVSCPISIQKTEISEAWPSEMRSIPIQGTAADIIKLAMYGPASDPSQKLRSRMVMQVHDELGVCCGARRS